MRPELLEQAMEHISDKHIQESATVRKRLPMGWISAVAAVLALVLLLRSFPLPAADNKAEAPEFAMAGDMAAADQEAALSYDSAFRVSDLYAVALASQSRAGVFPHTEDYGNTDAFNAAVEQWRADLSARSACRQAALDDGADFFAESARIFLADARSENRVYSPISSYLVLAMLAEVTDGDTRQQVLDALNAENLDSLRSRVSALWESVYCDGEEGIALLANSLWLDGDISYRQEALDDLAYYHYASSYQGALGSPEMDQVLQSWLEEQTGGLLDGYTGEITLEPETVLALASTVYYQAGWNSEFDEKDNTQGIFHSPDGDTDCTFMNKSIFNANYYASGDCGAIRLSLSDGSGMWLFLPEEGVEVTQLLDSGSYLGIIAAAESEGQRAQVDLSLPKFDVASSSDLAAGLKEMGVSDVFGPEADFSAVLSAEQPVYVSSVRQAVRVSIDEEGAKAAGFTVLIAPGDPLPEDLLVTDFILDRPFLFVIEKAGIPVFCGVVNRP